MTNTQFWHSSVEFDELEINTYYLAEEKLWFFVASDVYNIFDRINYTENKSIPRPRVKCRIRIFQNSMWQTIDVLQKEDILEVTKQFVSGRGKCFEELIVNLCSTEPCDCFLSKEEREYEFLTIATNSFLDLYEEINNCSFMDFPPELRFYKLKDFFSVYVELLSYQPIKKKIIFLEQTRAPIEAVISNEFIKFVRNILTHFPFFTRWDDVYISKQLINWKSDGQSIDRFLTKFQGHEDVQYRFKDRVTNEWRYPIIKFPQSYNNKKIYLKDIIDEKDGILLCAVLMYNVVSSQIIHR